MCSLVRKENHPMGIKWQTSAQTVLSDVHNPHNSTVRWGTIGPISQMSKQRQQRGQGTCPRMHSYTLVPPPPPRLCRHKPQENPTCPRAFVSAGRKVCADTQGHRTDARYLGVGVGVGTGGKGRSVMAHLDILLLVAISTRNKNAAVWFLRLCPSSPFLVSVWHLC